MEGGISYREYVRLHLMDLQLNGHRDPERTCVELLAILGMMAAATITPKEFIDLIKRSEGSGK